ncbi:MAG: ABC transporter permease [Pirellula sp.]|jgi:ABC-2 type transport system permease protein|nr:ABC transporter permease [Pirellula sp.]
MIWTVVQTSWRRLKNNRSELLLTFVVPVIFFSIFAVIFGSRGGSASGTPKIKVAISDTSETPIAKRATVLLKEQQSLRLTDRRSARSAWSNQAENEEEVATVNRDAAEDLVRRGMVSAAIVFEPSVEGTMPEVRVLTDTYDQVASQVVTALVQRAVMTALSESKTPPLAELPNSVRPASFANVPLEASGAAAIKPPEIAVVDVLGGKKTNPVIAMYAAGIAVMFVLFSATTASGSLLEERENSTLDRLLCSRLTMDQLLLGKWAYLTLIGVIQMTLMFTWGAVVFGIELLSHWEGFTALTIVTAGAAASFALFLASLCRTRTQLGWISTIVILTMSALGGSMVPRYLMSENIQRIGMITFNAWALEGYNKVFWRDLGLRDLEWELGVMTLCGLVFILSARLFAVRWERT